MGIRQGRSGRLRHWWLCVLVWPGLAPTADAAAAVTADETRRALVTQAGIAAAAATGEATAAAAGKATAAAAGEGIASETATTLAPPAGASAPLDWRDASPAEGRALLLLLLLLFFATWVTEDLTCIATGLLVARGTVAFLPGTLACLAGIFTSDLLLFLVGRHFGRPALSRPPLRWLLTKQGVTHAEAWFRRRGAAAILIARALPAFRVPTYVTAGLLGMRLSRFVWVFLLAASVWTPLLVGVAWQAGDPVIDWLADWSRYGALGALGLSVAFLLVFKLVIPLGTVRGRRLLFSRWQRLLRWEFWPAWLFYPPVVLYILYLGMRHRGLTVFTAANPAIPGGGFVGESKWDILAGLAKAGEFLPPTALLPTGATDTRTAHVARFRAAHGLAWPVVLKPNAGERGRDVAILRSEEQVAAYLARHPAPTLVQAYAAGHEFGVFYYRYPHEPRGHLFAITDKRPPMVVGDGESTLETLILRDARAVLMAPRFLKVHADRLADVPAPGEPIPLVELGTHCLGCTFYDGTALATPALTAAIDRISRGFEGFYFGRYDIRTPSVADFQAGRNFKIVELNGVTSEATSIYDPGHSVLTAWATLARQWRIAFEIGAENRDRGVRPLGIGGLWRLMRAAGRRPGPAPADGSARAGE